MSYEVTEWTRPSNYRGDTHEGWYSAGVGRSRDSDILEEANFIAMLELLGGESDSVRVIREGHWAAGWVEWIAIAGEDTGALETARKACDWLNNYPVLDDDLYSKMSYEAAIDLWAQMSESERADLIREDRASEGLTDEEVEKLASSDEVPHDLDGVMERLETWARE